MLTLPSNGHVRYRIAESFDAARPREASPVRFRDMEEARRFLLRQGRDGALVRRLVAHATERWGMENVRRNRETEEVNRLARLLADGRIRLVREDNRFGGGGTPGGIATADGAETAPPSPPLSPDVPPKADEPKAVEMSWVEIKLLDEADQPVPGEAYRVTAPNGASVEGVLDENGWAHVEVPGRGDCQITFPHLDKDAWERAPAG